MIEQLGTAGLSICTDEKSEKWIGGRTEIKMTNFRKGISKIKIHLNDAKNLSKYKQFFYECILSCDLFLFFEYK